MDKYRQRFDECFNNEKSMRVISWVSPNHGTTTDEKEIRKNSKKYSSDYIKLIRGLFEE